MKCYSGYVLAMSMTWSVAIGQTEIRIIEDALHIGDDDFNKNDEVGRRMDSVDLPERRHVYTHQFLPRRPVAKAEILIASFEHKDPHSPAVKIKIGAQDVAELPRNSEPGRPIMRNVDDPSLIVPGRPNILTFQTYRIRGSRNYDDVLFGAVTLRVWYAGQSPPNAGSSPSPAGPRSCDDIPELLQRRQHIMEQLDALQNAQPFLEQFQQVKQLVDQVHEVLQSTAADLDEVREKIDSVLPKVQEQNADLRNVRRWARSVYSNPDWEPRPSLGNDRQTISQRLESTSEWIGEIESQVGQFANALEVLENGVEAAEGRPSDQLEAFQNYFTAITDRLRPYARTVPLVRIFVTMFDYYSEAVGVIGRSVRQIEAEYTRRDEILRQLGPRFNNVRYHWPLSTPWERIARQKQELQHELAAIEERLRDCDVELDPEPPESSLRTEMRRAYEAADRHCAGNFDVTGKTQVIERRDEALRRVRRYYKRPPFFPAIYGADLTPAEELDYAQTRHRRWRQRVQSKERRIPRLAQEVDRLEERFQQYRRRELNLSSVEAGQLNIDRQRKREALQFERESLLDFQEEMERRDSALDDALQVRRQLYEYHLCLREWIEGLAEQLDWDPTWIAYTYPGLYRPQAQGFRESIPMGQGRLRVQLTDARGETLDGTVRIWRTENGETVGRYSVMSTNTAHADLNPGAYRLEVYSGGLGFSERRDVEVAEGRLTPVRVGVTNTKRNGT